MSATVQVATSAAASIPPFVTPILQAFGEAIRPLVILCLESAICVGVLLPLLACVLYFSSRRGLMWYLTLAELCYGLGLGGWNIYE
jgi:hypothetical protein